MWTNTCLRIVCTSPSRNPDHPLNEPAGLHNFSPRVRAENEWRPWCLQHLSATNQVRIWTPAARLHAITAPTIRYALSTQTQLAHVSDRHNTKRRKHAKAACAAFRPLVTPMEQTWSTEGPPQPRQRNSPWCCFSNRAPRCRCGCVMVWHPSDHVVLPYGPARGRGLATRPDHFSRPRRRRQRSMHHGHRSIDCSTHTTKQTHVRASESTEATHHTKNT